MNAKKIFLLTGSFVSMVLAILSYRYLAFEIFSANMAHFYTLAPQVDDACRKVVSDAAVVFTQPYDYITYIVAAEFLVLSAFLFWQGWKHA